MEVVLLEDVKALGKKGQVVKVNDGYARNFILPKKLGVEATAKNLNDLKLQKANDAKVAAEQLAAVKAVFATIGSVAEIPENHFGIFSVIGGAAVAFHYMYMDALARAALKAGMPKKQALEIVAETVKGSAEMVLKSGEAPWLLVDQVCSPGGTTIEGVTTLQAKGFEAAAVAAFDAVLEKDKKIGRGEV